MASIRIKRVSRHYTDDTTIDDVASGDQLSAICECGHTIMLAWRRLPDEQQFAPLRDLRRKMVCKRCGARSPAMEIRGFKGSGSTLYAVWRWPKA